MGVVISDCTIGQGWFEGIVIEHESIFGYSLVQYLQYTFGVLNV